jgi:hypothetical protein
MSGGEGSHVHARPFENIPGVQHSHTLPCPAELSLSLESLPLDR